MVKRLIMADAHLGSGEDLLRSPEILERLEPQLAWADELVFLGDLFELTFDPLAEAIAASRPFLALVARHVERFHYLPGNHDHHLVSLASDERRVASAAGLPTAPPFTVAPAERLLRPLLPGVDIVTAYPICELDGVRYIHGHYVIPHLESLGWRAFDRLSWALTGERRHQRRLSVEDYEALFSPLYELLYEMANLPQGKKAQQQWERWLLALGAVARAPISATRQVTGLAQGLARRGQERESIEPVSLATAPAIRAMDAVCENLGLPAGPVVFAHTHVPLCEEPSPTGAHVYHNPGSWIWDVRMRDLPGYREKAWPGTALRACGAEMEPVSLLSDLDEADMRRLLGHAAPAQRRRSGLAAGLLGRKH
jgi:hypothetical protein